MEILCSFLSIVHVDVFTHLLFCKQIVYICWLCFELGFVHFFVIETSNRTLEETSRLFDGEEATKHITGHAADQAEIYPYQLDKYDDSLA
jgi:hypothetical protein